MEEYQILIVVGVALVVIVLPAVAVAYLNLKIKSDIFCIDFADDDCYQGTRAFLTQRGIYGDSRVGSPNDLAHSQPGTFGRGSRGEIWVLKKDLPRVTEFLNSKYLTETTPTAVLVRSKI